MDEDDVVWVTAEEFDRLVELCQRDEREPTERILAVARRLDEEGYS